MQAHAQTKALPPASPCISPSPPASGGEGWGEGGANAEACTSLPPHPNPLPRSGGEGTRAEEAWGESGKHAPNANPWQHLHQAAESAGLAIGVPAETRPFHPHATLGRIRDQRQFGELPDILRELADFGTTPVRFAWSG